MNDKLKHLAVIMDGNGRWAIARGKERLAGHRAGAKTLERVLDWCGETGVDILTVYAFSTENWRRPEAEVNGLMRLLALFMRTKRAKLMNDKVRFRVIGRRSDLSSALRRAIESLEADTAHFTRQLVIALSYGGRTEIVEAARKFAEGTDRSDEAFARCLYAPDLPDPDLIVRTSGEFRLSNFLLWQCAYSEFYVTDVLWPDFDRTEFDRALAAYATRDRRMGGHK